MNASLFPSWSGFVYLTGPEDRFICRYPPAPGQENNVSIYVVRNNVGAGKYARE